MRLVAWRMFILLSGASLAATALAQSPAPSGSDTMQLEALGKKIDEQSTKIDALSQQLLKLEQQISNMRPGVMIGEATPPAAPTPATAAQTPMDPAKAATVENSHVVARGETLTSIAKTHKVGVEELQKFNHIENDRKLQAGQTILIPPATGSPTASPAPTSPAE
ncbi:MAG: LysM domain-containing protein [Chthoniobacterales bacterium]